MRTTTVLKRGGAILGVIAVALIVEGALFTGARFHSYSQGLAEAVASGQRASTAETGGNPASLFRSELTPRARAEFNEYIGLVNPAGRAATVTLTEQSTTVVAPITRDSMTFFIEENNSSGTASMQPITFTVNTLTGRIESVRVKFFG